LLRAFTLPGVELAMPVLFPPFVRDRGNDVRHLLHRIGIRSVRMDEKWRAYASLAESPNRHAFLRTLRSVIDSGGQSVSALDRIYLAAAVPTLIVWGEQDDIIPVTHAHAAHEAIPGSHLAIIEGAAHFVHAEQPDRFVEILTEFIEATDPAAAEPGSYRELLHAHEAAG